MKTNYLRQCKSAAANVAKGRFGATFDPDVTEKVISFVKERFTRLYEAAVAERGLGIVHQQLGKAVKRALRAENSGRRVSSPHAPCKTHQRLDFA
jgi:hypothetical protein